MPSKNKAPRNTPPSARPTAPTATPTLRILLAVAALIALVAIAYGNSLANGFVWDDHQQIVLNPHIKPDAPIAPLFTGDVRFAHESPSIQNKVYRPLQLLTYRITAGLFGATPDAFHAVSLAFAIAATLAAFWLFWLLTRRHKGSLGIAFAAAALFAVYPIHAEAVDWIAALPDLGCTLFLLAAFALYLTEKPRRPITLSLSLAAYAAALLWKETAMVFPLLIAAHAAITANDNHIRRAVTQSAPYFGMLAAYLALRFAVLGTLSGGARNWALSPLESVLSALNLLALYWAKLMLPLGLNAYYVFHPVRSLADPRNVATIAAVAAIIAGILYLLRRASISTRLAAFAILWIVLTLLPALNLSSLGRNAFAERYLYLPSAGFCLLLVLAAAWLIDRIPTAARRPAATAALLLVLAAFTTQTILRNPDWKDDATLFTQTLKQSPDAPFVRVMVANSQSDAANNTAAEENYLSAVDAATRQIPPDRIDELAALQGVASLYADKGQDDRALSVLSKATDLAPGEPNVLSQRGMILAKEGRANEARPLLDQSLAAQPENENALVALALIARDHEHDLARAAQLFSMAISVHPDKDTFSATQHNNLGAVYGDEGNMGAAITEFRQAVTIEPEDPEFHMNLATALAAVGRTDEAHEEQQTAQRIDPRIPPR